MFRVFQAAQNQTELNAYRRQVKQMAKAFVLVEVLLSMTILAVAGTGLLRSIQNSINAARKARETSKLIFLAKSKIHEYEMMYSFKPLADLGTFSGKFDESGLRDFIWTAKVDYSKDHDAYLIAVWVQKEQQLRSNWYNRRNPEGFKLISMVPTARYNDFVVNGYQPTMRGSRSRGGSRQRR